MSSHLSKLVTLFASLAFACPQTVAADDSEPLTPPADPNEAPFLDPPYGQRKPRPSPTILPLSPQFSAQRRFQLTAVPMYASFRLPLLGRPERQFLHGVGASLEADIQMWKWGWMRLLGSYSMHPLTEVRGLNGQDELTTLASGGRLHATNGGFSVVLSLDLGRFLPLLEAGGGILHIAMPEGVQNGQQGMPCLADGICDSGLQCSAAGLCQPGLTGELHFGVAVDALVRRNFSFGGQFRYYALFTAPTSFPVYLILGLRVGFRL